MNVLDEFSFSSEKGTLQINDFFLQGQNKINLKYGDVILQSTSDYKLEWTNSKHTFCFAAPAPIHDSIERCSISGECKIEFRI